MVGPLVVWTQWITKYSSIFPYTFICFYWIRVCDNFNWKHLVVESFESTRQFVNRSLFVEPANSNKRVLHDMAYKFKFVHVSNSSFLFHFHWVCRIFVGLDVNYFSLEQYDTVVIVSSEYKLDYHFIKWHWMGEHSNANNIIRILFLLYSKIELTFSILLKTCLTII